MSNQKPMPNNKMLLSAAETLETAAPYVSRFPSKTQFGFYTAATVLRKMAETAEDGTKHCLALVPAQTTGGK